MRIPLFLTAMLGSCAAAATINSVSTATDLIGGTVTVTRFGGVMSSATFVAGIGGSVIASAPGSGAFDLTVSAGDTISSTWTLTNTDPTVIIFNRITAVSIDLTLSAGKALFDNDSLPSTPVSLAGVLGVIYSSGATISSATEVNPWTDPANTGDMFTATNIVFDIGLVSGASSSWMDDTDSAVVPEPSTFALVAFSAAAYIRWRTRSSRRAMT